MEIRHLHILTANNTLFRFSTPSSIGQIFREFHIFFGTHTIVAILIFTTNRSLIHASFDHLFACCLDSEYNFILLRRCNIFISPLRRNFAAKSQSIDDFILEHFFFLLFIRIFLSEFFWRFVLFVILRNVNCIWISCLKRFSFEIIHCNQKIRVNFQKKFIRIHTFQQIA